MLGAEKKAAGKRREHHSCYLPSNGLHGGTSWWGNLTARLDLAGRCCPRSAKFFHTMATRPGA